MNKIKTIVIGTGYWGKNLLRLTDQSENFDLIGIVDKNPKACELYSRKYQVPAFSSFEEFMASDYSADSIFICTPPATHKDLIIQGLENDFHVWVEKPMVLHFHEFQEVLECHKKHPKIIHVDYTYLFKNEISYIKDYIQSGEFGELLYYDSIRINLGLIQQNINVIEDLAPHDLSILFWLFDPPIKSTSVKAYDNFSTGLVSNAHLHLDLEGQKGAHFHLTWLSPFKSRRITIAGTKKMILFDDLKGESKIKIFDKGVSVKPLDRNIQVEYRYGGIYSPSVNFSEPLQKAVEYFGNCIQDNSPSFTFQEINKKVHQCIFEANQQIKGSSL